MGPWEWDLKRLVASVNVAGRENGLSPRNDNAPSGRPQAATGSTWPVSPAWASSRCGRSSGRRTSADVPGRQTRRGRSFRRRSARRSGLPRDPARRRSTPPPRRRVAVPGRPAVPHAGGRRHAPQGCRVAGRYAEPLPSAYGRRTGTRSPCGPPRGRRRERRHPRLSGAPFGNGDTTPLFLQVKEAMVPVHAAYLPPMVMREHHEAAALSTPSASCRRSATRSSATPDRRARLLRAADEEHEGVDARVADYGRTVRLGRSPAGPCWRARMRGTAMRSHRGLLRRGRHRIAHWQTSPRASDQTERDHAELVKAIRPDAEGCRSGGWRVRHAARSARVTRPSVSTSRPRSEAWTSATHRISSDEHTHIRRTARERAGGLLAGPRRAAVSVWRRTRMAGDALQLIHRRVIALALLAWLPLLVLSVAEGYAWGAASGCRSSTSRCMCDCCSRCRC